MSESLEANSQTAKLASAAELSCAHDTETLIDALRLRLSADGHDDLASWIMKAEAHEAEGSATSSVSVGRVLLDRLRADGRCTVADVIASLMENACREAWERREAWEYLEGDGWIAERERFTAEMRALGHAREADAYLSTELSLAMDALVDRLRLDGHRDLAEAIDQTWLTFEERLKYPEGRHEPPRDSPSSSPPDVAAWARVEALAQAHSPDVLAGAVLGKLLADHREVLAGTIMTFWMIKWIGPIADPAALAAAVVPRLRAEGRGEVADTVTSLLRDAPIARDPSELRKLWQDEVSGPLISAAPLGAALVRALREDGRGEVADSVGGLLAAVPW
jgi:hypothetical protein